MAKDIFFRVDDDIGAEIERRAKVEGRSVSNFVRTAMIAYLGLDKTPGDAPELGEGTKTPVPQRSRKRKTNELD